jgi:aspartate/methionine/tyrosine aminotransferase
MDVSRFTNDSTAFAGAMLRDIGVGMTPGADFDPLEGRRYLRASFAGDRAAMETAVRRLKTWLKTGSP